MSFVFLKFKIINLRLVNNSNISVSLSVKYVVFLFCCLFRCFSSSKAHKNSSLKIKQSHNQKSNNLIFSSW